MIQSKTDEKKGKTYDSSPKDRPNARPVLVIVVMVVIMSIIMSWTLLYSIGRMMIATTFVIILCCYLLLCIPIDLFFKSAADLGAVLVIDMLVLFQKYIYIKML